MQAPGWQTEDLAEEWVESASIPEIQAPETSPSKSVGRSQRQVSASASFRQVSYGVQSRQVTPMRIVSGHVNGGRGHLPSTPVQGLLSPPTSDSGSSQGRDEPRSCVVGTFVIKEDQDVEQLANAKALPFNPFTPKGGKGDFFTPLALERMFQPPSPPTPAVPLPKTNLDTPLHGSVQVDVVEQTTTTTTERRVSAIYNPYAPVNPSRLSKSVTPPSRTDSTIDTTQDTSKTQTELEADLAEEEEMTVKLGEQREEEAYETDLSPIADHPPDHENSRQGFQFTFAVSPQSNPSPSRARQPTFSPPLDNFYDQDTAPSHSTIHPRGLPLLSPATPNPALRLFQGTYDTYTRDYLSAMVDAIPVGPSPPGTVPRRAIFSSASHATLARHADEASPSTSGSTPSDASASRSSKRIRLSPPDWSPREGSRFDHFASPSPPTRSPRQPGARRDWGQQGMEVLRRIRESRGSPATTVLSAGSGTQWSGSDAGTLRRKATGDSSEEMPEYTDIPPTPPLESSRSMPQQPTFKNTQHPAPYPDPPTADLAPQHRSQPSTTSSAYVQNAATLMQRIKARAVSDSASGVDASPIIPKRVLSNSTADNGGSSSGADVKRPQHLAVPMSKRRNGPSPRKLLRRLSAAEEIRKVVEEEEESEDELAPLRSEVDKASAAPKTASSTALGSTQQQQLGAGRPSRPTSAGSGSTGNSVPRTSSSRASVADSSATVRPANHTTQAPAQQSNPPPDDLNRYVSSSTMATATTTSASFVKHRGPPPPAFMTRIGPSDIQNLPERIGRMVFDKEQMRWVKQTNATPGPSRISSGDAPDDTAMSHVSEDSVDIFAGMGSLQDGSSRRSSTPLSQVQAPSAAQPVELQQAYSSDSSEDEEDRQETMSSRASPQASGSGLPASVAGAAGPQSVYAPVFTPSPPFHTSKPSFNDAYQFPFDMRATTGTASNMAATSASTSRPLVAIFHTPTQPVAGPSKPFRSALRNAATPVSALKKKTSYLIEEETPRPFERRTSVSVTPFSDGSAHKRSVSFSDGKKAGKMMDAERIEISRASTRDSRPRSWTAGEDLFSGEFREDAEVNRSFLPSARTQRIAGVLEDLEELSLEQEGTPSKPPAVARSTELSQASDSEESDVPILSRSSRFANTSRASRGRHNAADATFLTECSFGVAHDNLVQLITDVQPFEPHWEELRAIDLSGKNADSVARLKEFLPKLDELNLCDNRISYLSGIPSGVRRLQVASNRLTSLTAVNHLRNLQYLDISKNQVDSVTQLKCLKHLRELKADGNMITDISSIMGMDNLIKFSCNDNCISRLDFTSAKWQRLEVLSVSGNQISTVVSLDRLTSICSINLDSNKIDAINTKAAMPQLRVLRISDNKMKYLDLSRFPRLRTLFADSNEIARLTRSERGSGRMENLSLRNQRTNDFSLSVDDLRDVKRLYISGNPLRDDFFPSSPLYSLIYLEAAACKLSQWPTDFSKRAPNLRVLNLNYNFIDNLSGLVGLSGLRKLMVVGGRLGERGTKGVVKGLRGLSALEEVDLRMNPCTLSFYLPLLLPGGSVSSALNPSEDVRAPPPPSLSASTFFGPSTVIADPQPTTPAQAWSALDHQFRRSLPDMWYSKRLVYRGLVMAACENITVLDGVAVGEGEKDKARRLLERAMDASMIA